MAEVDPRKLHSGEGVTCRTAIGGIVYNFEARVEDVDKHGIIVPLPNLGGPVPHVGGEVLVRYYRPDSAYQFLAPVLAVEEEVRQMRLGFPRQITRYQRRRHERHRPGGTVRFRRLTSHGPDGETERGFVVDASAGGIQFTTRQVGVFSGISSPVGVTLSLDIHFPDGAEFTGLGATVRRVRPDPSDEDYVRVQAAFSRTMSAKERERLQQALQRAEKRK